MRTLPARDRWVVALALVAAVLAVVAARLQWHTAPDRRAALGLVLVGGIGAIWQRERAARLAWLFVVPAVLVGRLWQVGRPVASATFGWFAYAPLPGSAQLVVGGGGSRVPALTVWALVLVLWTLTTLGLVALVSDARPLGGSVRVLAVVAGVLTAPLWAPPTTGWSLGGLPLSASPTAPGLAAVRTTGLVLVLVVGAAVVVSRSVVPARATAYVLPAAALTWVWWHADAHGRTVYAVVSGLDARPTWVDALWWTMPTVAETALVTILWFLTIRGARVLLVCYRPPQAVLTP